MSRPFRFGPLILIALVLAAGCGKTGRNGTGRIPSSPDGSPVLARVGDYLITAKQVETRIKESAGEANYEESLKNPDIIQVALGAIMDQVVWGKAGESAGYDRNPSLQREVYLYKTELVGNEYLKDTVDRELAPTEQEITEFYDKFKDHYSTPIRVSIRHIQCKDRAKAESALKRVLNGEDFSTVARQMSEDENTRELGGALGFVSQKEGALGIGKDESFIAAALKLQQGETSPIVQSARGFHVLYCEAREGGVARPLDEVRDDIIRRVQVSGKISDVYNTKLQEARQKYKAEVFQDAVDAYTGVSDSVERLWQVVEMQPNERGQIEVLRRIAMDFPKHELADDAQLRIAYLYGCKLAEPRRAQKAIASLRVRFPNSDLLPAANWLDKHLADSDIALLTFEDLKTKKGS